MTKFSVNGQFPEIFERFDRKLGGKTYILHDGSAFYLVCYMEVLLNFYLKIYKICSSLQLNSLNELNYLHYSVILCDKTMMLYIKTNNQNPLCRFNLSWEYRDVLVSCVPQPKRQISVYQCYNFSQFIEFIDKWCLYLVFKYLLFMLEIVSVHW